MAAGGAVEFSSLGIRQTLLYALYREGFRYANELQRCVLTHILQQQSLCYETRSNAGMTLAATIAALELVDTASVQCQAVLLYPARELARMGQYQLIELTDYLKVKTHTIVGGTSIRSDLQVLSQGVQVVSGTPGRIYDTMLRGKLNPGFVKFVAFLEADEMAERGFSEQVLSIRTMLPQHLTVLFATSVLTEEVRDLAVRFSEDCVFIDKKPAIYTLDSVRQYYFLARRGRLTALIDLVEMIDQQLIVLCAANEQEVAAALSEITTAECISRSVPFEVTRTYLRDFRTGCTRVLVAPTTSAHICPVERAHFLVLYDYLNGQQVLDIQQYMRLVGTTGEQRVVVLLARDYAEVRRAEASLYIAIQDYTATVSAELFTPAG